MEEERRRSFESRLVAARTRALRGLSGGVGDTASTTGVDPGAKTDDVAVRAECRACGRAKGSSADACAHASQPRYGPFSPRSLARQL